MWWQQLPGAYGVLFFATFWTESVNSENCTSREASKCQPPSSHFRLKCGNFTLKKPNSSQEWLKSQSALEIPLPTAACQDEAYLSEAFQVHYGKVNGSYLWRIAHDSLVAPNSSHVLFSTLKKPMLLKDRKSANSDLVIRSYISLGVAIRFYTHSPVAGFPRRSVKLIGAKPSDHLINITFNVSGDHELDRFSLERTWMLNNTTSLHCTKLDGGWTTSGCRTVYADLGKVECECSFIMGENVMKIGVLTQVKTLPDSRPAMPLYVALTSVSTVFFAVTLLLLMRFRSAFKDSNRRFEVQINLTVSLFLRHTFLFTGFAISLFDPLSRKACEGMGVLHAYFLVTSVLWVLSEGVIVYRKVCKSSLSTPLSTLVINAVLVWGLPFLLLIAVSSYELAHDRFIQYTESFRVIKWRLKSIFSDLDKVSRELENYRKYDFCWTTSRMLSLAIGIPVTISLIVNTVILVWVGVVVWKIRVADSKNIPARSGARQTGSVQQTMSTFRAVVLLTAMLGIPWLFSLFYNLIEGIVKQENLVPSYIHFAFISLQGPALFYLYCLHNQEFRRVFQRSIVTHNIKKDIASHQASKQSV